jgi:hypothetical protein
VWAAGGGGGGVSNPLTADLVTGGFNIRGETGVLGQNLSIKAGGSTGPGNYGGGANIYGGDSDQYSGGAVRIIGGNTSAAYAGGDVVSYGGNPLGTAGNGGRIILRGGDGGSVSGNGGDIVLDPGAGEPGSSRGAIVIPDNIVAPLITTNKMYNEGGDLYWDGVALNSAGPIAINPQVGVTYTGVLSDAEKMITLNNAAAIAMTIPANASVAYPVGTQLNFMQLGAGQVTVGITSDTLNVEASLTTSLAGQYAVATALKVSATEWTLFGNLEAV